MPSRLQGMGGGGVRPAGATISRLSSKTDELEVESCTYYPRVVMGEYLRARFMESVKRLEVLAVRFPSTRIAKSWRPLRKGKRLTLRIKELVGGKIFSLEADRVLLATGHWFNQSKDARWFSSPWPARALLEGIPNGASVAVLGSSLSAVDAVLTLTSEDEFFRDPSGELKYRCPSPPRKIALFSRKGILPKVRGKLGGYKNRFLTQGNVERLLKDRGEEPALEGLFRLLRLDLEAVYGHPMPWAEVMSPSVSPFEILEQRPETRQRRETAHRVKCSGKQYFIKAFPWSGKCTSISQQATKIVSRSSTAPSSSLTQPRCPL